ncbi:nuclear transport factor 2 family protein [Fodinibius sp. SL11]|uniref:nuclear transport factor 2 family protein n=1 Tax=Fodinibius sp. SL11 TaxID=3425690 RepID=UPI003F883B5F
MEYYKADIYDLTVNVAESGTIAWYFHKLDAKIKSRDTVTTFTGARFTGVMQKKDSKWVMAQTHLSLPANQ